MQLELKYQCEGVLGKIVCATRQGMPGQDQRWWQVESPERGRPKDPTEGRPRVSWQTMGSGCPAVLMGAAVCSKEVCISFSVLSRVVAFL